VAKKKGDKGKSTPKKKAFKGDDSLRAQEEISKEFFNDTLETVRKKDKKKKDK